MFSIDESSFEDFTTRLATADDASAIWSLLQVAARPDASEEERARKGFVQGQMGQDGAAAWAGAEAADRGAVVVEDSSTGSIVGALFFTGVPPVKEGLPPMVLGIATVVAEKLNPATTLAYGPLAVSDDFAGRGLASLLIHRVAEIAARLGRTHLAAGVEDANRASLGLHQHLGAEVFGNFKRQERGYHVVGFALVD
ncbi:GNAT family N-acetyltransferase [Rothia aerolata]|uniref:N-acetyltransferase domain-containing protein n=1 Tax=Rothia aerolata TaxID=1812262 RepID=A0A917IPI9_9MICC|nr:GNAT family N-acetyltransferase [Rothia aerolata]GGH58665.1 hypothetical protein GCM10007359_05110 [Rothia aerolata]